MGNDEGVSPGFVRTMVRAPELQDDESSDV
jgi:hypothetical protein